VIEESFYVNAALAYFSRSPKTEAIARAVFPKGNIYVLNRDNLGSIYSVLPEQQGFPSNTWLNRPIDNFGFYGVIHGRSRKNKIS
jgi:hypothetical protein